MTLIREIGAWLPRVLLALAAGAAVANAAPGPIVVTRLGPVVGTGGAIQAFRGIPYPPGYRALVTRRFAALSDAMLSGYPAADDAGARAAMRAAWARFAATGDPNGPGLPAWPAYDVARDPYLDFGDVVRTGEAFRQAPLDLMRRINDAAAAP
jgi:hypothetical protein